VAVELQALFFSQEFIEGMRVNVNGTVLQIIANDIDNDRDDNRYV
jgi:hypothetical protein